MPTRRCFAGLAGGRVLVVRTEECRITDSPPGTARDDAPIIDPPAGIERDSPNITERDSPNITEREPPAGTQPAAIDEVFVGVLRAGHLAAEAGH